MAVVTSLDSLLATRTLWHAGRSAAIAADGEPSGHAALDALLPQGGWPRRALTELLLPADGVGELSLLLPTLARCTQQGERVVVIAPPYLPYAPAWQAAGVDLSQLRIVEAGPRDALWAFEQCLRSGTCAAVLGWPQQADARALRRLQVAADSGQCLGFALRDRRHLANPSPAALRLEAVRTEGGIAWQVRKCRGGPVPAQPFMPQAPDRSAFDAFCHGWGEGQRIPAAAQAPITHAPVRVADFPARRLAPSSSPASGEGSGREPAGRDTPPCVLDASLSVFGSRGREKAPQPSDAAPPQAMQAPARVADFPARRAVASSSSACGAGPRWLAGRDAATGAPGSRASAFGSFPRERTERPLAREALAAAPSHPQRELPFVPAAPLARD